DNAFNGINGDDIIDHTAKVLAILELIKIPNVDPNQLRLHVFPLSLTGDARMWWIDEDDIVSSDDKREESDNTNHLNDNSDPFFKPYFDAQEGNNISAFEKGQECFDKHKTNIYGGNISELDDISVTDDEEIILLNEEDLAEMKKMTLVEYLYSGILCVVVIQKHTPPITYPKDVEETLGTLMEVEHLDQMKLEDVGLDTCNHEIPLSSREVPSFDEPELQPKPLANCPSLYVIEDDFLREGLSLPIKPKELENDRIKETHHFSLLHEMELLDIRRRNTLLLECPSHWVCSLFDIEVIHSSIEVVGYQNLQVVSRSRFEGFLILDSKSLKVSVDRDRFLEGAERLFSAWAARILAQGTLLFCDCEGLSQENQDACLLIQHGCESVLEVLPADMEAQTKAELNKKAHSVVIVCLDEFNKIVLDLANIEVKFKDEYLALLLLTSLLASYKHFVDTFLYGREDLTLEDVMATLNSNKIKERSKAEGDNGEGLYVRGRTGPRDSCQSRGKSRSKYRGGRLKCYICQSKDQLKRNCPKNKRKKSICYVKKDKQPSSSGLTYEDSEKQLVENQTGRKVKKLRTDNGLELCNQEFEKLCIESEIARHLTVTGTSQQNGLAERMNRTLMDKVRYLLIQSGLPKTFWVEATCTNEYLINRSPSTAIEKKTPMEMWSGHPSDYGMLRIFGCVVYPHDKQGKLEPRAVKCVILGYPEGVKGYRLYRLDDESPKIVTSRNVVFNESVMYKDTLKDSGSGANKYVEELQVEEELQRLNNHMPEEDKTYQEDGDNKDAGAQETNQTPDLTNYQLARDREPRTRMKPLRFRDESNMVAYAFVAVVKEDTYEPLTYQEADTYEDSSKWKAAIKEEMDSLRKNKT
nr:hypothetical protein [Tanacetum cinerariifolium]